MAELDPGLAGVGDGGHLAEIAGLRQRLRAVLIIAGEMDQIAIERQDRLRVLTLMELRALVEQLRKAVGDV